VSLKASEFPRARADQLAWSLLGVKVEDLTPKNRRDYRITAKEGVLVKEVRSGSQLARVGVKAGDLIRQIDESGISDHEEFKKALVRVRQKPSIVLLIQRGEQGYYVTVTL
jgi:S1-C subfamily serine protease